MLTNRQNIVVIDYGMGNLRSIFNKFRRLEFPCTISSQIEDIKKADKLVLPGVGHFAKAMDNLRTLGLVDVIKAKAIVDKSPILGICLGMQLLMEHSEEGDAAGLGFVRGNVVRFRFQPGQGHLKIPHMGWNSIIIEKKSSILKDIPQNSLFYFVHSYHAECYDPNDILARTEYGYDFVSAVQKENVIGTQFHPEKSHDVGLQVIKNFLTL